MYTTDLAGAQVTGRRDGSENRGVRYGPVYLGPLLETPVVAPAQGDADERWAAPDGLVIVVIAVLLVVLASGGTYYYLLRPKGQASATPAPTAPALSGGLSQPPTITGAVPPTPTIADTVPPTTTPASIDPANSTNVALNATITASSTASPGEDGFGNAVSYNPSNLTDGDPTTAWRTPGDGIGVTITVNLQQPVTVTGLGMINGYAKIDPHDGTDRYAQERRITSVTYSLDGGQTFEQMLSDGVRSLQVMSIPPTSTTTVTITIDSTTAPGDAKHDYTAASEIQILGQ